MRSAVREVWLGGMIRRYDSGYDSGIPTPIKAEGGGGQNQSVKFHFFLLGNPRIVIQPLEWNCKVTFLNKPWALVGAKRKYDHGSAIFWRDAIPIHVLPPSDKRKYLIFTCLQMTWNNEEY